MELQIITRCAFRKIFNKKSVSSSFSERKLSRTTLFDSKICILDTNFTHFNREIHSNRQIFFQMHNG
jgi:hypothetical protein